MSPSFKPTGTLLICAESSTDGSLVAKLLIDEFPNVFRSIGPDEAAADFDRLKPDVLVLVFGSLEKAERFNLGLYRQSLEIHRQPHRTIVLCNRDEIHRAYELCRSGIFEDYILFWPLTYDGPRLAMAVHHALRDLAASKAGAPKSLEFALQAKRLAELEELLKQRMTQGDAHIESTCRTLAEAEETIGAALDGFSQRLVQGDLAGLVEGHKARTLQQAFDRLKEDSIEGPLQGVAASVQPLKRWAGDFRQASGSQIKSLLSLQEAAETTQPAVLLVDDDVIQHKIVANILKDSGYQLFYANSGIGALNLLHKLQPDLILMDISMPDMDGLELTRRVKGVERFAGIPIIMITVNSEETIVTECLQAGALDFMVKPLKREALIAKVAKGLEGHSTTSAQELNDFNQSDL